VVKRTGPGIKSIGVNMRELDGVQARTGWFETARYPNGMSVATVAIVQEHGSAANGIPPRPFFRPTIVAESNKWFRQIGDGAKAVFEGRRTALQVLETVALGAAGDVAKSIERVKSPPLKPATIKNKVTPGNTKPLVDSGQMIQSVTGVAERTK
jgi:hypothetical protein